METFDIRIHKVTGWKRFLNQNPESPFVWGTGKEEEYLLDNLQPGETMEEAANRLRQQYFPNAVMEKYGAALTQHKAYFRLRDSKGRRCGNIAFGEYSDEGRVIR